MSDLIRRMDAIQACQIAPSDEWSRATRDGYTLAATECAMAILRCEPATAANALEAERAKVAAAYEAAGCVTVDMGPRYDGRSVHYHIPEIVKGAIRALTPADAQAALDKMLTEARAEGWRAGRDAAARYCVLYGQNLVEGEWGPEGLAVMLGARIRALPEPKEVRHDD